MGSESGSTPTPQSGLSALEETLSNLAHKVVDDFKQLLEGIKNNHGVNSSAVQTLLHQSTGLIENSHNAVDLAVLQETKDRAEAKVEPPAPPETQKSGPEIPAPPPEQPAANMQAPADGASANDNPTGQDAPKQESPQPVNA